MFGNCVRFLGGLVVLTGLAGLVAPSFAAPVVNAVRIGGPPSKTRFVLDLNEPVKFTIFTLADPYRVVIDLPEVAWRIKPRLVRKGARITGYRFGLFRPGQSRVVIDVRGPVKIAKAFSLGPKGGQGHRLVIDLVDVSRAAFLSQLRPRRATRPPLARVKTAVNRATGKSRGGKSADRRPLIAIDAGHGGVDPGARGHGGWEKGITLKQALELRRHLLKTGRYRVVMTRNRDVFVRLSRRIEIAQAAGADLFISIHADSIANKKIRGGSVYTLSEKASDKQTAAFAAKENKADIIAGIDLSEQSPTVAKILIDLRQRMTKNSSIVFARTLIGELVPTTRMLRKKHRFAGFAVLKAPEIPSVLLEMGYLSNRYDEKLLRHPAHRRKIAAAISRAIDSFFARQQAFRRP
jgi:N-acetylmuramoyl-L-alanine amidase